MAHAATPHAASSTASLAVSGCLTFRSRPKSFLDPSRRDWQFEVFAWLLRNTGGHAKFVDTTLVLPIEDHFPDRGMKGHAGVAALFRRVRDHAGMSDWPCDVEPEQLAPRVATPDTDRVPVITYPPGALEPLSLVATFAHELAGHLIESFDESPPGGAALREPANDVAAVFMGFGLFLANSAMHTTRFNLNEGELVHALAIFCLLRKMQPESIDRHLNPHLRKYLRLATRDLAQHESRLASLRAICALTAFDIAERTLPTSTL